MEIVSMEEKHIKQLAQIEIDCFSDPWSEKSFQEELGNDNALFIVAQENDEVLGYIGCHTVLDEGYIANVATSINHRRCGIAKKLIDEILFKAQQKNLSFLTLEVRSSNLPAINLYANADFKTVGTRKNYYTKPTEDAILMTKTFT